MDIERPNVKRRRWVRRGFISLVLGVAIIGVSAAIARLERALPSVDRHSLLLGKVRRGVFLREVQGIGTLTPEQEMWVTASTEGEIKTLPLKPGTQVHPDTVLMELQNPNLDLDVLQTQWALKSAIVQLQSQVSDGEDQIQMMNTDISELEDEYKVQQLQSSGDEEMSAKGFIPPVKLDLTKMQLASIQRKIEVKRKALERSKIAQADKLKVAEGNVEQAQAMYDYKVSQREFLQVRAGVEGVLMGFTESVGFGKRVGTGAVLAKVVDPSKLKAELKVSEQQARDLVVGLPAKLEVLNQTIRGKVIRINPGVIDGNVAVDIALEEEPPHGARPDLSISGVIEIDRVEDAIFVERPFTGIANSPGELFKVNLAEGIAIRVPVIFGRTSAMTIEIAKGLEPGDEIIYSDMSRWDNVDKLRIE